MYFIHSWMLLHWCCGVYMVLRWISSISHAFAMVFIVQGSFTGLRWFPMVSQCFSWNPLNPYVFYRKRYLNHWKSLETADTVEHRRKSCEVAIGYIEKSLRTIGSHRKQPTTLETIEQISKSSWTRWTQTTLFIEKAIWTIENHGKQLTPLKTKKKEKKDESAESRCTSLKNLYESVGITWNSWNRCKQQKHLKTIETRWIPMGLNKLYEAVEITGNSRHR